MELIRYNVSRDAIYLVNKSDLKEILKTGTITETKDTENMKNKVYVIKENYSSVVDNKAIIKVLVLMNKVTYKLSDVIEKIDKKIEEISTGKKESEYYLGKISIDEYLTIKYQMLKKELNNEVNNSILTNNEQLFNNEDKKDKIVNKVIDKITMYSNEYIEKRFNTINKINQAIEKYSKKRKISGAKSLFEMKTNNKKCVSIDEKIDRILEARSNNQLLVISKKYNKIYLPYTIDDLEEYLKCYPATYLSLKQVVEREYTIDFKSFYKNPIHSRFVEAYSIVKDKERKKAFKAIFFAIKIAGKRKLNPAVVAACRTQEELNTYIKCLKNNSLEKFKTFEVVSELITA